MSTCQCVLGVAQYVPAAAVVPARPPAAVDVEPLSQTLAKPLFVQQTTDG